MFCRRCGRELAENARFCSNCGEQNQIDETNTSNQNNTDNQNINQNQGGCIFQKKIIIGSICSFILTLIGTTAIFFPNLFNFEKKNINELSIDTVNSKDISELYNFLNNNINNIIKLKLSYTPLSYSYFSNDNDKENYKHMFDHLSENSTVYVLEEDYIDKGKFDVSDTEFKYIKSDIYGYDIIPHCEKILKHEGECFVSIANKNGYYYALGGFGYIDYNTKQLIDVDTQEWARSESGAHPVELLSKCNIYDIACQTSCLDNNSMFTCGEYPRYPLLGLSNCIECGKSPSDETLLFGVGNNFSAFHKGATYNGNLELIDQGTINFIWDSTNDDPMTYLIDVTQECDLIKVERFNGFIVDNEDANCMYAPVAGITVKNNHIQRTTDINKSFSTKAFKDNTTLALDYDAQTDELKHAEHNGVFNHSFSINIPYSTQEGKKYTWKSDNISQNLTKHDVDGNEVVDYKDKNHTKITVEGVFFVHSPTVKDSDNFPAQYCSIQHVEQLSIGNSRELPINCQSLVFSLEPLSPKEVEQRKY